MRNSDCREHGLMVWVQRTSRIEIGLGSPINALLLWEFVICSSLREFLKIGYPRKVYPCCAIVWEKLWKKRKEVGRRFVNEIVESLAEITLLVASTSTTHHLQIFTILISSKVNRYGFKTGVAVAFFCSFRHAEYPARS